MSPFEEEQVPKPPPSAQSLEYQASKRFGRVFGSDQTSSAMARPIENERQIQCVIKVLNKKSIIQKGQISNVNVAAHILKESDSPFVMRSLAVFQDRDNLYLLMKFATEGNLYTLLQQNKKINESQARRYAAEMLLGLSHIHSLGFVHRNLKPGNILITVKGHLCLSDFGLSLPIGSQAPSKLDGTAEYMSPEVFSMEPGSCTPAGDIYAFGVVLFELLTGRPPFARSAPNAPAEEVQTQVCKVGPQGLPWQSYGLSNATKEFLCGLLSPNPMSRMQEPEIRAHPWFIPMVIAERERAARRFSVGKEEDDRRMFSHIEGEPLTLPSENGSQLAPPEDLKMFSEYRQNLAVFLHL